MMFVERYLADARKVSAGGMCGFAQLTLAIRATLKRRYGLDRSRRKGDQGRQVWTEWAILAYNADTLAVRRLKHSEPLSRPEQTHHFLEWPHPDGSGRSWPSDSTSYSVASS